MSLSVSSKKTTNSNVTVENMLIKWLSHRNNKGQFFFFNHNLDNCKSWIKENYNRTHNVSTIERAFRQIRETKKIQCLDASLANTKEKRWYVISLLK